MKDLKDFEQFYQKWCERNHKPFTGVDKLSKQWQEAWQDFIKEELVSEYDERKDEYMNMELINYSQLKARDEQENKTEQTSQSLWDQVKSHL